MAAGVTIEDPATTYVDRDVIIGPDTHPSGLASPWKGRPVIGRGCEIHSGVRIRNSRLSDGVTVFDHCVITDCTIASGAHVGPFAHLRPGASLGERRRSATSSR